MNGIDLMQTPYNEICEITASLGYPAFRAKQIYGWAMKGTPVDEMSNLPAELRKKLTDSGCFVFLPEIKKKLVSAIDGDCQIPVRAPRRSAYRERRDEVRTREHNLCLQSGGVPDGMPVLCLDPAGA